MCLYCDKIQILFKIHNDSIAFLLMNIVLSNRGRNKTTYIVYSANRVDVSYQMNLQFARYIYLKCSHLNCCNRRNKQPGFSHCSMYVCVCVLLQKSSLTCQLNICSAQAQATYDTIWATCPRNGHILKWNLYLTLLHPFRPLLSLRLLTVSFVLLFVGYILHNGNWRCSKLSSAICWRTVIIHEIVCRCYLFRNL